MMAWHSASKRRMLRRDVVVDDEDGARAVVAGVANVGQHAVERVGVEVAAAHLDDRAEAAIEGAAARGLDHVDLPAQHGVAAEHAGVALGQADLVAFEAVHRARQDSACQPSSARYDRP